MPISGYIHFEISQNERNLWNKESGFLSQL
jgi:hypothetical protein